MTETMNDAQKERLGELNEKIEQLRSISPEIRKMKLDTLRAELLKKVLGSTPHDSNVKYFFNDGKNVFAETKLADAILDGMMSDVGERIRMAELAQQEAEQKKLLEELEQLKAVYAKQNPGFDSRRMQRCTTEYYKFRLGIPFEFHALPTETFSYIATCCYELVQDTVTQGVIAERLGVSQGQVSKYLMGDKVADIWEQYVILLLLYCGCLQSRYKLPDSVQGWGKHEYLPSMVREDRDLAGWFLAKILHFEARLGTAVRRTQNNEAINEYLVKMGVSKRLDWEDLKNSEKSKEKISLKEMLSLKGYSYRECNDNAFAAQQEQLLDSLCACPKAVQKILLDAPRAFFDPEHMHNFCKFRELTRGINQRGMLFLIKELEYPEILKLNISLVVIREYTRTARDVYTMMDVSAGCKPGMHIDMYDPSKDMNAFDKKKKTKERKLFAKYLSAYVNLGYLYTAEESLAEWNDKLTMHWWDWCAWDLYRRTLNLSRRFTLEPIIERIRQEMPEEQPRKPAPVRRRQNPISKD